MRPVAVVTGASRGIGHSIALEFASKGYDLALIARSEGGMKDLQGEISSRWPQAKVIICAADVTEWDEIENAAKQIASEFPSVNFLINNAGAYEYSSLDKTSIEKMSEVLDVNVKGVMMVTKAILPLLKAAGKAGHPARVLNVSSIAGLWGFNRMSVYSASKSALHGFAASLRRELKEFGVEVATIYPGPVYTKPDRDASKRKGVTMFPEEIAQQIYELSQSRRFNKISHPAFALLNWLEACSPASVDSIFKKLTS